MANVVLPLFAVCEEGQGGRCTGSCRDSQPRVTLGPLRGHLGGKALWEHPVTQPTAILPFQESQFMDTRSWGWSAQGLPMGHLPPELQRWLRDRSHLREGPCAQGGLLWQLLPDWAAWRGAGLGTAQLCPGQ